MSRFTGKIALVTGSGRGIGRAIALRLAKEGADVIVNYFRNRERAEETAAAISALGRRAQLIKANVAEEADLERLFEAARAFGGLDMLINNAASGYNRPVLEQRAKGWDWTLNINARAALFASQQAAALMQERGGGAIVNISSIGAQRVVSEYVLVGVSKAALEALTRYLAVELAPLNIAVNAVSGGFVETDALKHFSATQSILADPESFVKARVPAGRMVSVEDIAAAVAFLCSTDAAMIRGQVLVVDGGFTLTA
jgi:enoyl-[acyl-carrier protein] reductase III